VQLRSTEDHSTSSSGAEEYAGSASLCSSSLSLSSTPSQFAADSLWCADTGPTAHLTPDHYWLRSYRPHRVPVRLTDSTIVYSAGMGSVVFVPELEGKRGHPVEFSNVLHVPDLRSNVCAIFDSQQALFCRHLGDCDELHLFSFCCVHSASPCIELCISQMHQICYHSYHQFSTVIVYSAYGCFAVA